MFTVVLDEEEYPWVTVSARIGLQVISWRMSVNSALELRDAIDSALNVETIDLRPTEDA